MGPDQRSVQDAASGGETATELRNDPVRVVHGTHEHTAQTPGMHRRAAIDKESVGTDRLWFGRVTCPPGMTSGPHHHAEAETAGHMLSGDRIRIYFGANYEEYVDIEPGDYLFVPAYVPHIEVNMSDTVAAEFVTARTPGNIVVSLEETSGDAPPETSQA
jgi:uncharacterized RmlC-like cupin family protein